MENFLTDILPAISADIDINLFLGFMIVVLGASLGSFLSVVIYRLKKKKKGVLFGRSMCPYCNKKLKWKHMFPVFSYLFLGGKCAYCKKRISLHYLALEIVTAGLFLLVFLNFNFITKIPSAIDPSFFTYDISTKSLATFFFYIIEFGLMSAIFFYDLLYMEIPDRLSIPTIVIALAGAVIFQTPDLVSIAIGLSLIVAFFGGQIFLSRGKWLGGGDLRLGALMAILLGWKLLVVALILSYFVGALVGIIMLIAKKAKRSTALPFGPFLIIGLTLALFFGDKIISTYMKFAYITP